MLGSTVHPEPLQSQLEYTADDIWKKKEKATCPNCVQGGGEGVSEG